MHILITTSIVILASWIYYAIVVRQQGNFWLNKILVISMVLVLLFSLIADMSIIRHELWLFALSLILVMIEPIVKQQFNKGWSHRAIVCTQIVMSLQAIVAVVSATYKLCVR